MRLDCWRGANATSVWLTATTTSAGWNTRDGASVWARDMPASLCGCGVRWPAPTVWPLPPISRRWRPFSTARVNSRNRRNFIDRLRTYRREYGSSHPEIAVVLNNLGALYQATARSGRAESSHRVALEMKGIELGARHPDVAVTLNNLALCCQSRGDANSAGRSFQRAVRILHVTLGTSHPTTQGVRNNFCRLKAG